MEFIENDNTATTLSQPGASTFTAFNPATGEALPNIFTEATDEEVDQAVRQAEEAFLGYRQKSGSERAAFLERIAEEIMALGDELISVCTQETGLPEARLQGERGRTMNQLKLFAEVVREGSWVNARIDTALPDRQPLPRPDLRQLHIALGPVGVFGASNFPLAFSVAGGDTASALAAGCTVVVKGHPAHPGTSELVGQAITRAAEATGMPRGVFGLVQGASVAVGMALVTHPLIKAIGFTGSFRGGTAIYKAAAARPEPIPVYAEMGSTNPVFVLPGALQERSDAIAQGLAASATLGVGQFCTNPGLVVAVASPQADDFIRRAGSHFEASKPGTMLTSGIRQAYHAGVERLRQVEGVELVAGGPAPEGSCAGTAYLLRTSAETLRQHPALAEEVFGPSSLAVTASGKDELLQLAENLQGHLTATLHATAEDLQEYADLVRILERKVGRLLVNGFPTGVEVSHAMIHGGPYPATTDARTTSVGTAALYRFARPVCYQDFPAQALPPALQNENPLGLWRLVNGQFTREGV
jgi:alpha-ketoglutaric semialdehyde dehydrogenase